MGAVEITAKEMGRRGGLATAKKLTPEQRKESARRAARARWAKKNGGGNNGGGGNGPQNDGRTPYLLSDIGSGWLDKRTAGVLPYIEMIWWSRHSGWTDE